MPGQRKCPLRTIILLLLLVPLINTLMPSNKPKKDETLNDRPVVGILAQESYSVDKFFPNEKYRSFIAASYVKYVESSGARVIPIMIKQNESYYKNILDQLNGVVFPGGATFFNQSDGYADAGMIIYRLAKAAKVPILGICLGMELITFAELDGLEHRVACDLRKVSIPLDFKPGYRTSKMFRGASHNIIRIFKNENVTYNYHQYCITEQVWNENGFNTLNWKILATNKDKTGVEFISAFESTDLPIYGLQFHPEKVFEWAPNRGIVHTKNALLASQYLGSQFIDETRKTGIRFNEDSYDLLIYNYLPNYIGNQSGASYQQLYMFK